LRSLPHDLEAPGGAGRFAGRPVRRDSLRSCYAALLNERIKPGPPAVNAGFGTVNLLGFIKDKTGTFALALVPLVALATVAALVIILIGRSERRHDAARRTRPATR
jgi:hypothetical protein